jgi:4-hydroxybenzoate polyprenyltransferase
VADRLPQSLSPSLPLSLFPYHFPVRALAFKLITAIRLTRLTMAFGAVSDVWFVILLTRAEPAYTGVEVSQMPLAIALIAGAVVATGLFAYGASLNDILDVRHDSTFSPDRPIPAGRIKLGQAIVVTVASLLITVVAAAPMGRLALWIMLLVAAAILFYNAAGRFIPAVGMVTIGLIHAAHMMIPNAHLSFTLPVWLVMTHAMGIAAAVHVLEDKRPRLGPRGIAGVVVGWLFWSALVIGYGVMCGGIWPEAVPLWRIIWPITAVAGFVAVSLWKAGAVRGAAAAEKVKRYGAMWQALYGAAWLMALGLEVQAAWLGAVAVAGFVVMTAIKEIAGLSGRPVVYR